MKIKCHLVKPECVVSISNKAYKFCCYNGSEDIIPKSQVFGINYFGKTPGYWVAAWLLEKKNLQYSVKKARWYNQDTGKLMPCFEITKHVPDKVKINNVELDEELIRQANESC